MILNHGDVVLSGNLKEIKRECGKERFVLSVLNQTSEELGLYLTKKFSELLVVEKIQREHVVIRQKQENYKNVILQKLLVEGLDLEFFGLYEPSLNDIFVEKAGDQS